MLLTQPDNFSGSYRTIKHDALVLVDNVAGLVPFGNHSGLGLYYRDTRFLSTYEIQMNQVTPIPLFSSTETGFLSTIVYTNPSFITQRPNQEPITVDPETIQLKRETVLDGIMYERFSIISYNEFPVFIQLRITVDADFKDMFEIRNLQQEPPGGEPMQPLLTETGFVFSYLNEGGPDPSHLQTEFCFESMPAQVERRDQESHAMVFCFEETIYPHEAREFIFTVHPKMNGSVHSEQPIAHTTREGLERCYSESTAWYHGITHFVADRHEFNGFMRRSQSDIRMLLSGIYNENHQWDQYIAAGIPWYVALFGRDSLIAARDCLLLNPGIACSTLRILAKYQGREVSPWRDEEPGKILHELRLGELARQNLIPHTPYYGSVDATPLWLILFYEYYRWTNDRDTLNHLWPNALKALEWIRSKMASDPTGFLTYQCQSEKGLYHQHWKDSHNSAMYEDGRQAEPPLAMVEVQAYVYLAFRYMSSLAQLMGDTELSQTLTRQADDLYERFNQQFWMNDLGFYALALDSQGKPLRVISSNPGHCLQTGIVKPEYQQRVAERLMAPDMFNGWGIRTLSSKTSAYNPMSYHNGSVWPHDNAMIVRGFQAIGRLDYAETIFNSLYDAGRLMFYKRMPELFCGFSRDFAREFSREEPPVKYPVACSPQAWAASSIFSLLGALCPIEPVLNEERIIIHRARLPELLSSLGMENLRIKHGTISLAYERDRSGDTRIAIRQIHGNLQVSLVNDH